MKYYLLKILILTFIMKFIGVSTTMGKDINFPTINGQNKNISDFVPDSWRIDKSSDGDLNGDGTQDIVLVLQGTDSSKVVYNKEGLYEPITDKNPRILCVFLKQIDDTYRICLQHNYFLGIVNDDEDDHFQSIDIKNGQLLVRFQYYLHPANFPVKDVVYTLHLSGSTLRLIRADLVSSNNTADFISKTITVDSKVLKATTTYSVNNNLTTTEKFIPYLIPPVLNHLKDPLEVFELFNSESTIGNIIKETFNAGR